VADRRRQIIQLIGSRYDLLHFPSGALRTSAGLAPGEKRPCPSCGHTATPGWITDKFEGKSKQARRRPCRVCGGAVEPSGRGGQYVRKDAGKGFVYVDRMDAQRVPVGDAETKASARPRKTVKCDRCQDIGGKATGVIGNDPCPSCNGTGTRDLHVFDLRLDVRDDADVDALTAAIERRDQAGSYHELEAALRGVYAHTNKPLMFAALTVNARQALRLLDEIYLPPVDRQLHQLTTFEQSLVELALAYIDTRMPDPIRVPPDVRVNERELEKHLAVARGRGADPRSLAQRDKQIRQWARENLPYPWICQQTGLKDRQVREIINGRERVA
jgi:hypothetical protein